MYSWSCLIVTLLAIYGYRLYKNVKDKKELKIQNINLIIFGIFSITACYIHYYALAAAGIINFFLLIYFIKNRKENAKILRNFIILAIIQVIAYIPWLLYLKGQVAHVENGFWIALQFSTLIEVLSFQFRRQLDSTFTFNLQTIIALVASLAMYIYIGYRIYKAKKEKSEMCPGMLAIILYIAVILAVLIISLKTPILYARYLIVVTGLYIFGIAYFMAKEKRKWVTICICAAILILGCISNVTNIMINYDSSNMKQIEYLKENIQPEDIIVYSNIGNGGVIAAFFPDNKQYFYNGDYWDVEEAYKAYGPGMEIIYNYEDILKDYHGRIWLIDSQDYSLYNAFPKESMQVITEPIEFKTKYQNYVYTIILLEKE